jgi:protease-4
VVCALLLLAFFAWLASGGSPFLAGDRIARVDITGIVADADEPIKLLKKYARDERVKAIVLRIDSPGGQVAPSQELYRQIRAIRKKGKPVVASLGSVAASGAYYIACAAEKIYANPGTITGSIGVVAQFPNVEELVAKVGVKMVVIKSGRHKDMGNPFRALEPEERALIKGLIDDVYQQFIEAVVEGRGMEPEAVKRLADGRIFSGRQALELGLVDKLGGLQEAIADTARAVGIEGEPVVVYEEPGPWWWLRYLKGMLQARLPASSPWGYRGVSIQYRWVY